MVNGNLDGLVMAIINLPLRENARTNTPPQGPGLLAANLRQRNAAVSIIDLNGYRISDQLAKKRGLSYGRHLTAREAGDLISRYFNRDGEPAIIALSGMITTLRWQETVAQICRQLIPEAFIISGGGLATEIGETLLSWITDLNAIVLGEGDEIILTIAEQVRRHRDQGHQAWHQFLADKKVYRGTRLKCLDGLPFPAWDLLERDVDGYPLLEDYIQTPVWGGSANNSSATSFTMDRSLTTVSSRGCPHGCAFCWRGTQGQQKYRNRSADDLIKEAVWLRDCYQLDFLGFPDDNFAIDKKRLAILAERFQCEVGLLWGTHTRLDEADDRLALMVKAGCIYIGFGAESASASVLTRMNKGGFMLRGGSVQINGHSFPRTMVDGIKHCHEVGIHSNCTWIMAYPGETLNDLKTSVAFILWQTEEATEGLISGTPEYERAVASINRKMFTATAYPGTAMFSEPKVRQILASRFSLSFDRSNQPVHDRNLKRYVESLDDATKVLTAKDGSPVNYGEMSDDQFLIARDLINRGQVEKILSL